MSNCEINSLLQRSQCIIYYILYIILRQSITRGWSSRVSRGDGECESFSVHQQNGEEKVEEKEGRGNKNEGGHDSSDQGDPKKMSQVTCCPPMLTHTTTTLPKVIFLFYGMKTSIHPSILAHTDTNTYLSHSRSSRLLL